MPKQINTILVLSLQVLWMATGYASNPIISGKGVCDPHVHIFDDTAYLFASHDYSSNNTSYIMYDWNIWKSTNLVDWEFCSAPDPKNTYIGPTSHCWATDAASRNGKYYFYFSNWHTSCGVMDANSPGGPYTHDLIGGALTSLYDPTLFIDDDANQTPYLVAGVYDYYIQRLNNDMKSFATPGRTFLFHSSDDKNYLHKRNGIYYLSWASWYATSSNLTGPYALKGFIGSSDDHGNFFSWSGQDFQSFTIYENGVHFRATGLTYVNYLNNGNIAPTDQLIVNYGVGRYEASWDKIQAEWFMKASYGALKRETPHGGFETQNAFNNSWLQFPNVENMASNTPLTVYYANGASAENQMQIRRGSVDGPLLGTCALPSTGSWSNYVCASCTLTNPPGTNSLCLVFVNGNGPNLDWFTLGSRPNTAGSQVYTVQNERWGINELATNTHSGGYFEKLISDTNAANGKILTYFCYDGAYAQFNSVYGGAVGGQAVLTFDYCSQSADNLYTLYVNGKVAQTISFPNTGGWTMAKKSTYSTTVTLQPLWNNVVTLEKYKTVGGINLADLIVAPSAPSYGHINGIKVESGQIVVRVATNGIVNPVYLLVSPDLNSGVWDIWTPCVSSYPLFSNREYTLSFPMINPMLFIKAATVK